MKNTILAAAAAVAMLSGAAPAVAATTGPAIAKPKTDLTLSYQADAGYAAAVKLTCDPVGGAHPTPKKACTTLKSVGGDPGKLAPADGVCTMEYAPITAAVTGTWKGKQVHWQKEFGNSCAMGQATGVLFSF